MHLFRSPIKPALVTRLVAVLGLVTFLTALPVGTAQAADRVALVLGNGAYKVIPGLPNAVGDARAMAATLETVGFTVVAAYDLDRAGMEAALRRFGETAEGAEAALVFYAGHGVQTGGTNYLLPLDATADEPADLRYEAIALGLIEAELADTGAAVRLIILDACRDNPLIEVLGDGAGTLGRSSGVTRGLAPVPATGGTLHAYATAPGAVALDGEGPMSPFTTALIDWLPAPGLEVSVMFRRVREQVIAATDGAQVPWVEDAIVGRFYFVPPDDTAEPPAPAVASDPAPGAADVPVEIGRIRLVFDREMATDSGALVPAPDLPFPSSGPAQGRWLDAHTFEVAIGPLLAQTGYGFRINSATHHGFRIAETGQPWPETLIRFTTAAGGVAD